ncbi:putative ABC transporter permease [Clostridium saccharobutylicum]|uniref:ABC-transporter type IV n=1 Tax=Clostridium saccharobutylicum DSM 13864 TaxID=1345695 RepID=U5MWQ0_CLOSA|nr:putative ABC transporter permease [Clostridium saccharobutylicum]AGX45234.1 hypothetical protein CLSA_c42740 [Clostridium saccharobutylicum DSM 13864]AQR92511.1 hypothetical protein CLOSC_42410 [Clostridium saccharobutylicum]AQS02414.1 hypothetical protein CSACC_42470 [Clostridium saccharobutylicum]AQS12019.1 hypothetical protein CLOBY_41770 [Clostridium saccharobutylicum]AQS16397.1 hypothetical protein CLOSACC_42470 [Clostridium saccharobutylicum]
MNLLVYLVFNFIIYSFIGWLIEELYAFIVDKRFKKEGFLIGPFKPMYGIAMTLLILYDSALNINRIILLVLCFFIPTTVEYVSGYMLKHIFNKVYWDYSNLKYNVNGFITLKFSLYWTVLSFIGVKYIQPIFYSIYISAEEFFQLFVIVSIITFIIDFYFTLKKFAISNS